MDTLRLTFVSLSARLLALVVLVKGYLRIGGMYVSPTDWLFHLGRRPGRAATALGRVLFGADLFKFAGRFYLEIGVLYFVLQLRGKPSRPTTWAFRVLRG